MLLQFNLELLLGAETSADTLTIRSFTAAVETSDVLLQWLIEDRIKVYRLHVLLMLTTFASQAGYEKRRLRSRRSKRSYDIKYTSITGVEKTAIENFYNARSGEFESFSFDLSHINETGTITTRFQGPLSIEQTYSTGSRLIDNFYMVSFNFKRF